LFMIGTEIGEKQFRQVNNADVGILI
jgi:hypothetical protein